MKLRMEVTTSEREMSSSYTSSELDSYRDRERERGAFEVNRSV